MLLHGSRVAQSTALRWVKAGPATLTGERETGGHTNYYPSSDPSGWRVDVPHFRAVRARGLYPGIDVLYHSDRTAFEFDAIVSADADPEVLGFDVSDGATVTESGDLKIGSGGPVLRTPEAWQMVDGVRHSVPCRFVVEHSHRVRFVLGNYDHSRTLTIDPIIEYATYLGGNGNDLIYSLASDPSGSAVVGGVSTSTNFPGASFASAVNFSYVTKLSADGSSVVYTTVLGSGPDITNSGEIISGIAVDADGGAYVTGTTTHRSNFPITAGAWNKSGASYAVKLDASGHLIYGTYLASPGWSVTPSVIRVRNGIAYLAGSVSALSFLGTPGAYQRDLHGQSDFFVLALAADGSAPIFVTAIGGSSAEWLYDMNLDANGDILLCGYSGSSDFPVTTGGSDYPIVANQTGSVVVRLKGDGSALLDAAALGTENIGSIAASPDGTGALIIGDTDLPTDLTAQGRHTVISLPEPTTKGYVAKLSFSPIRIVWTTSVPVAYAIGTALQTDAAGYIYYSDSSSWVSGGAPYSFQTRAIVKLSTDGSRLEYIKGSAGGLLAVQPNGEVFEAGSVFGGVITTAGSLQTSVPPKIRPFSPPMTGYLARIDTSGLSGDNFFVKSSNYGSTVNVTWRIGEPPPATANLPLLFNSSPFPLTFSASNAALAASVAADSSQINVGVVPSANLTAGTTQEKVTIAAASDPLKSMDIPVTFTVQPQVSITLDTNEITFDFRQGQSFVPPPIGITENFGKERFQLNVTSSLNGLYAYIDSDAPGHDLLKFSVGALDPGTYDATMVIGVVGLKNANQMLHLHLVVHPPATIQLSTSLLTLHVVKGQPVTPISVNVTSTAPNVSFSLFVGTYPLWLQFKQIGTTTPGSIQFTADVATADPGYYSANFFVTGEANQRLQGTIVIDVSSGAPLDVTPSSVNYTYYRGGQYGYAPPALALTSPTQAGVTWSADQPWITPATGSGNTPYYLPLGFDTKMPEGVYKGDIVATSGTAKVTVPVVFTLYDTPYLVFSQTPFVFNYRIGDPRPPDQTLKITCPTLNPARFSAGPMSYPGFLSVTPRGGTTPETVSLTVDPSGLAPGTYSTQLAIQPLYGTNGSYTFIPVTLNVTADPNASPAKISSVVDAASYLGGTVVPGEIVALFGSQIGPTTLNVAQPDSQGSFPFTLAGTAVSFDGFPAPLIYVSGGQVAAVAPFEISGQATTSVTVSVDGKPSAPVVLPVASVKPSIFTADTSGSGQAAALRVTAEGVTSLNNAASPAAGGEALVLYVSGLGVTAPRQADGVTAGTPLPALSASIQVLIGNKNAKVLYAGPAPTLIAGVSQINVEVPAGLTPGVAQVLVIADGTPSAPGATVTVK